MGNSYNNPIDINVISFEMLKTYFILFTYCLTFSLFITPVYCLYHFVNSVGADEVRHAFNGYSVPTLIDQNVNFLIIKGNFHAFVLWLIGTNTFGNMSIHATNGTGKWKATHTERRQIIYYTVQIERFSTNLNNLHRCYVISHFSF